MTAFSGLQDHQTAANSLKKNGDRRLCIAPMLDWTDRHDRWFLRRLTRRSLLYTEMVAAQAIIHGDPDRFLAHDGEEAPLALQLGGSDPAALAQAVRLAAPYGFYEINLNVGCPSERVAKGRFGACLMAEPSLVADCVTAMAEAADGLPVTVKHRIGIDDLDSYDHLTSFVATLTAAKIKTLIVHARKAWLQGLSPKENRTVPPLRHDVVHRLKADFPDLEIILNGGIDSVEAALPHLSSPWGPENQPAVDGVMIGRAAYETPFILANADALVFGDPPRALSAHDVARSLVPYAQRLVAAGEPVNRLTRHILGLFHGQPGARSWRRHLSNEAVKPGATEQVIVEALALLPPPMEPS